MSEKKQVIHVKDLVIKADNVYVERSHHRSHHPFFDSKEERDSEKDHHKESNENKHKRRPFPWF